MLFYWLKVVNFQSRFIIGLVRSLKTMRIYTTGSMLSIFNTFIIKIVVKRPQLFIVMGYIATIDSVDLYYIAQICSLYGIQSSQGYSLFSALLMLLRSTHFSSLLIRSFNIFINFCDYREFSAVLKHFRRLQCSLPILEWWSTLRKT